MGEDTECKTYGEVCYTAYREHTHHKSAITGLDIPPWGSLAADVQAAWEAAAEAVELKVRERHG